MLNLTLTDEEAALAVAAVGLYIMERSRKHMPTDPDEMTMEQLVMGVGTALEDPEVERCGALLAKLGATPASAPETFGKMDELLRGEDSDTTPVSVSPDPLLAASIQARRTGLPVVTATQTPRSDDPPVDPEEVVKSQHVDDLPPPFPS